MLPASATTEPITPFTDGFGTRVNRIGANVVEEVLEFRPELLVNSFEFAVRERVGRLAAFEHPFIARVKRVERARDRRSLALVSAPIDGTRLTTLLVASERRTGIVDPVWALGAVHQILEAVSALHKSDREVVHGAIGPDRIIVSPEFGALVADYVLGSAIEQLHYSPSRYWADLGVSANAMPGHFTQRLDVRQTGLVALALLSGRRLREEEAAVGAPAQSSIASLVDTGDRWALFDDARRWLRHMLEFDAPFASAAEAADALRDLIERHATSHTHATWDISPNADETIQEPAVDAPQSDLVDPMPLSTVVVEDSMAACTLAIPYAAVSVTSNPHVDLVNQTASAPPPPVAIGRRADPLTKARALFSAGRRSWYVGIAAACLLASAAGVVYRVGQRRAAAADSSLGTLVITTPRAGAAVFVDETKRGVTPITVRIMGGQHLLELRDGAEVRTLPVTVKPGVVASQYIELSEPAPSVGALRVETQPEGALVSIDGKPAGRSPVLLKGMRPGEHTLSIAGELTPITQTVVVQSGAVASVLISRHASPVGPVAGWIGITSSFPVQIFEQDRLIGGSQTPRIMLSAGTHHLKLVNSTLGFDVPRNVEVTAGKVTEVDIQAPKGTLALNAVPWASVWLDGKSIGDTPLGNISTAIGTHEVVFRNPSFGEQRRTITVPRNGTVRLSVDLRTGR